MKTFRTVSFGGLGVLLGLMVANLIGFAFIGTIIGCITGGVFGVTAFLWKEIHQSAPHAWKKVEGWKPSLRLKRRVKSLKLIILRDLMTLSVAISAIEIVIMISIILIMSLGRLQACGILRNDTRVVELVGICGASVVFVIAFMLFIDTIFSTSIEMRLSGPMLLKKLRPFFCWKWSPFLAPATAIIVAYHFVWNELIWFTKASPVCFPRLKAKIGEMLTTAWHFVFELWKRVNSDTAISLFVNICAGVIISRFLGWHTPMQHVYAFALGAMFAGISSRIVAVYGLKVQPHGAKT